MRQHQRAGAGEALLILDGLDHPDAGQVLTRLSSAAAGPEPAVTAGGGPAAGQQPAQPPSTAVAIRF